MNILNIKNKHRSIAFLSLVFSSMLMLSGCGISISSDPYNNNPIDVSINTDNNEVDDIATEDVDDNDAANNSGATQTKSFVETVEEKLNPEILTYDGVTDRTYSSGADFCYKFMMEDSQGEIGEQVTLLYDTINDALKTNELQGLKIEVWIESRHFQPGVTNVVAIFRNYDDQDINDHISYIYVNGIDDMYEDYDSSFRYELNNTAFWDTLPSEYFGCSGFVTYQSEIDNDRESINGLVQYLMDDYQGIIKFGEMDAVTDGVHTPSIVWEMSISTKAVENSDDYASETELFDAVRQSINEYYSLHPNDTFLNHRLNIYSKEANGSIKNFHPYTKDLLGGFDDISYKNATADELINCKDVKVIDLFGRPEEKVVKILDNIDSDEIELVIVRYDSIIDNISSKYPNIEFK